MRVTPDGAAGWDAYAPFYDWENAQTLKRRDVRFWTRLAVREGARTLELGCGTGRLLIPVARTGTPVVGIDRSAPMLAHARRRVARLPRARRPGIVRADIRQLPFAPASFGLVMAPYGMLQSLVTDRALARVLREAQRVLMPGGLLGIDLVPDLPRWAEYGPRLSLRGRTAAGEPIALVESVKQDRRAGVTIFDERYTVGRGRSRRTRRFTLAFRTLSIRRLSARLERAGFSVSALLGDYRGAPWDERADVWIVLARRTK
jgi:SAM-dependent methyltransferase